MKRFCGFFIVLFFVTTSVADGRKVGLTLSGGGALGFAHVGVLQAFADNGIEFDCVVGTSMGAIVGSLYAAGVNPQEMLQLTKRHHLNKTLKLISVQRSSTGISSHKALREALEEVLPINFDSLQKPFFVSVTNLTTAQNEIVSSGEHLIDYVVASASVPGIFEVVDIAGNQYVDGGVLNNMPAQALVGLCDVIVGVDVVADYEKNKLQRTREVTTRALRMMIQSNSLQGQRLCNYLIKPQVLKNFSETDFDKHQEIYQFGYNAVIDFIAENPKILRLKKQ